MKQLQNLLKRSVIILNTRVHTIYLHIYIMNNILLLWILFDLLLN